MNLSYGLAKTGGATEFDWAFDTDLGIQTNFEPAVSIIPAKGAISKLVSGLANLTVSTTITADAAGTTTALATTTDSAAGADLTVLVSSNGIIINSVAISVAGTGYLPGDTVTVTKAAMDADATIGTVSEDLVITLTVGNFNTVTPTTAGSGYSVPLNGTILCNTTGSATGTGAQIFVRTNAGAGNGQVIEIVSIMGGIGYAVGDVLVLQEVGSSQTGTATVTVGTLDLGQSLTPAPNSIYPRAVRVAEGTIAAPVTIEFVGMDDVNFTVGGLITGTIFPMNFKQIKSTSVGGTDVTLGLTTILY